MVLPEVFMRKEFNRKDSCPCHVSPLASLRTGGLLSVFWVMTFFMGVVWAAPPLHVAVSIPPQAYFVKQIGGKFVSVQVMLPPGANPGTFEPKARALVSLATAAVYFRIHVPFEDAWMDKFRSVNPKMKIVDTTEGLEGRVKGDPHVWLSPEMVRHQAEIMAAALASLDAGRAKVFEKNLAQLERRLNTLTREIKGRLGSLKRRTFLVYHPCWGYFAREFGLTQVAIEREGKSPGVAHLAKIIRMAQKKGLRCIFAQPQFDARSAEIIARQIHGRIVFLDPMARDWDTNLLKVAEKIEACLEQ